MLDQHRPLPRLEDEGIAPFSVVRTDSAKRAKSFSAASARSPETSVTCTTIGVVTLCVEANPRPEEKLLLGDLQLAATASTLQSVMAATRSAEVRDDLRDCQRRISEARWRIDQALVAIVGRPDKSPPERVIGSACASPTRRTQ